METKGAYQSAHIRQQRAADYFPSPQLARRFLASSSAPQPWRGGRRGKPPPPSCSAPCRGSQNKESGGARRQVVERKNPNRPNHRPAPSSQRGKGRKVTPSLVVGLGRWAIDCNGCPPTWPPQIGRAHV